MRVTMNGESTPAVWGSVEDAPWPEEAKDRYARFVCSLREQGLTGPVEAANYAEPRPWKNDYDRGSDGRASLVVTIDRQVWTVDWRPGRDD